MSTSCWAPQGRGSGHAPLEAIVRSWQDRSCHARVWSRVPATAEGRSPAPASTVCSRASWERAPGRSPGCPRIGRRLDSADEALLDQRQLGRGRTMVGYPRRTVGLWRVAGDGASRDGIAARRRNEMITLPCAAACFLFCLLTVSNLGDAHDEHAIGDCSGRREGDQNEIGSPQSPLRGARSPDD